jgi:hypothetical protein
MSAYKKIECNIVDKETLLEALKALGFNPDVCNEPQNLKGYKGDVRKEVAHIIIPKDQINFFTGASNDIGFLWNSKTEKYDFICSEYDKKKEMDIRIIQAYVKIVLEKSLLKQGYKIKVNIGEEDLLRKKITDLNMVARKLI